jgi:RimJ/RimL family protein N-acetyltransferase
MTGKVLLRDVKPEDLPIFFEYQLDPEATRMAAFPSKEWEAFMAHWTRILADETNVNKTILYDGRVAGNIMSFVQSGERDVGYWIGKEFWGKGIATRALSAFVDEIKERPLYARVAKHNIASLRVLEKCDFKIAGEGTIPGEEHIEEFILVLYPGETNPAQ